MANTTSIAILIGATFAIFLGVHGVGEWRAQDPSLLQYNLVAQFACDNQTLDQTLKCYKLLAARSQVVRGVNYKVIIEDENQIKYEAHVLEDFTNPILKNFTKLNISDQGFEYRDPDDADVQDFGRFAVQAKNDTKLVYRKLFEAQMKNDTGSDLSYQLIIQASGRLYSAKVSLNNRGTQVISSQLD